MQSVCAPRRCIATTVQLRTRRGDGNPQCRLLFLKRGRRTKAAAHRAFDGSAGNILHSAGRRDPEHLLVERLPVRRDLPLDAAEGHRPVADEVVELVLELVLDVEAGRVGRQRRLFGVEVGDVVGAAELEPDDVVDLERAAVAASGSARTRLDVELLRLRDVADRACPEAGRADHRRGQLRVVRAG